VFEQKERRAAGVEIALTAGVRKKKGMPAGFLKQA